MEREIVQVVPILIRIEWTFSKIEIRKNRFFSSSYSRPPVLKMYQLVSLSPNMSNHRRNSEFSRSYSDVDKSYGNSSPHASSRRSGGAKYFANLLDYGNNTNDYETVKSSMASTKSVDSIATRRSSLSLSLATVPSLVIDVPKSIPVKGVSAAITFATTIPIVTRDKYDLFGVGGKIKSIVTHRSDSCA